MLLIIGLFLICIGLFYIIGESNADMVTIDGNMIVDISNTTIVDNGSDGWATTDGKVYSTKRKDNKTKKKSKKLPTISMWAKPSIRGYGYSWHKVRFIDYCPNCKHYNALLKNPKGVYEREYTCKYCDSDYCAVTGKEKFDWSKVYLLKA